MISLKDRLSQLTYRQVRPIDEPGVVRQWKDCVDLHLKDENYFPACYPWASATRNLSERILKSTSTLSGRMPYAS